MRVYPGFVRTAMDTIEPAVEEDRKHVSNQSDTQMDKNENIAALRIDCNKYVRERRIMSQRLIKIHQKYLLENTSGKIGVMSISCLYNKKTRKKI